MQEREQLQIEGLQKRMNPGGFVWRNAVLAGLAGGLVFLVAQMSLVAAVLQQSIWAPVRMIAALVMGQEVLPPPATFAGDVFLTALVVHFLLAVVFTAIGTVAARVGRMPLAMGGLLGLLLYVVNFHVMTAVFPWFTSARGWVTVVSHILFGMTAAGVYHHLRREQEPSIQTPKGMENARERVHLPE